MALISGLCVVIVTVIQILSTQKQTAYEEKATPNPSLMFLSRINNPFNKSLFFGIGFVHTEGILKQVITDFMPLIRR